MKKWNKLVIYVSLESAIPAKAQVFQYENPYPVTGVFVCRWYAFMKIAKRKEHIF